MNYELLKSKMDRFFEETTPEELVSHFEKMGYIFIDTRCPFDDYNVVVQQPVLHRTVWEKLFKKQTARRKTL